MDFNKLLTTGVERGASDLHLKPNARPILRVLGNLEYQDDLAVLTQDYMDQVARKLLGERRYAQLVESKEMDFAYVVAGVGRFRVNMFLATGEIRAVLRVIPARIPKFEELHLPPVIEKLALAPRGLVLVTGVTGSGKTTTQAAMIDYMNRSRNDHILTIEDPIEFAHEDKKCIISQREIGLDSENFATALRAALREDPDIILVGEMRDAETMEVALHAAETGHLVLSTLHTLNATETVNRVIAMFPPHQEGQIRDQLAAVIQGVVSQRLIVRADGKGRVPAVEVLVGTGIVRDCIKDKEKTAMIPAVMIQGTSQYGMQTFDQSLLALYRSEMITYETARDAASNPDDFELKVKGVLSTAEMTMEAARPPEDANRVPGLMGTSTPPSSPSSRSEGGSGSFFRRS